MAATVRERGALFLVFSIIGAIGVTAFIFTMIQEARSRIVPQRPEDSASVVVAAKHIPPGRTITSEMLDTRKMLSNYIPPEAIKDGEDIVGRVAMERILAGEFIREDRLAPPEAGVGLPAIIPRGMRGYQLGVRGSYGMSGFLSPGNFVDVIAVCTKVEPPETRTILRSVTVIGVNDRLVDASYDDGTGSKKSKKIKPSVTVALTPSDTVLVKHAQEECEIYLALRNDIDVTSIESNELSSVGSFGGAPGAAPREVGVPVDPGLLPMDGTVEPSPSGSSSDPG